MFKGTLPASVQRIFAEHARAWRCAHVYIGCSGNFTIERVLAPLNKFALHSNDVQLYSVAIGQYLAGQPLTVKVADAYRESLGWLDDYLIDPDRTLAGILLAAKFAEMMNGKGQWVENAYYRRQREALRTQWADLHERYTAKIKALPFRLESFHMGDVCDWPVPDDAGFASFPPFAGFGPNAYQKAFANLARIFGWQAPSVPDLDQARIDALIQRITARDYWMLCLADERPALADHLRAISRTTSRGIPVYVYAASAPVRAVAPRQKTVPCTIPRLSMADTVGDTLTLRPLADGEFNALRSQYLNESIRPGAVTCSFGVLVDGKLIGVYALSVSPTVGTPDDTIYLMSDFAVSPTAYKRLAKLVLYAALSNEAKLLAERLAKRRIRFATTTAFSNNPVSMKYRGMFDLISRKEIDADGFKYALAYRAPMGGWSLAEGLTKWKHTHANTNH